MHCSQGNHSSSDRNDVPSNKPNAEQAYPLIYCIIEDTHLRLDIISESLPTGRGGKEVLGVGSVPVVILPPQNNHA